MPGTIKQELLRRAKQLGFDLIRITTPTPLIETGNELRRRIAAQIYPDFAFGEPEERVSPHRLLPGTRSVITVATAYSVEISSQNSNEVNPKDTVIASRASGDEATPNDAQSRGILSRYAWGQDYHRVMLPRLQALAGYLQETDPEARCRVMVDTGPITERAFAYRSGLGFFGWNSCIITERFGSWVFLGVILTTVPLEADPFVERTCRQCGRCLKACPTGAIIAPYVVNPYLCLSYVTQMKGIIPEKLRPPLGRRLFGCDTCQAVCPHNADAELGNHPEFFPHPEVGTQPSLAMVLNLTNRRFQETFARTAAGWRGKKVLQRNAVLNLGNIARENDVPLLAKALQDPTIPVRASAAWALGQIRRKHGTGVNHTVTRLLEAARKQEAAGPVLTEIEAALS